MALSLSYEQSQGATRPPLNFLPAGHITWAHLVNSVPAFIEKARRNTRGRKRLGDLYERVAHQYLCGASQFYTPGPWIVFLEEGSQRRRFCQPDGLDLNFQTGKLTIVEIKLRHTPRAWWQVRKLYEPVLKILFPPSIWTYQAVEVCRYFDPNTVFPEHYKFVANFWEVPSGAFGLHLFSGGIR